MPNTGILGRLLVVIGGDPKALNRSYEAAIKRTKRAARELQSVGRAFTAAVSVPVAGLGAVAIKAAADLEQLQVAFRTLTGSADEASRILQEIRDFAATTPFRFDSLAKASRNMLAFGFETRKVVPTLKVLADQVAAISGGGFEFDRVVRAIGQIASKGKLAAQEVNQLGDLGIPIRQILAEGFGVTVAELVKMQEEGIDAREAINILIAGIQQRFSGLAQEQSRTIRGLFSTLQDVGTIALQDLGKEITEALDLRSRLGRLIQFTRGLGKAFAGLSPDVKKLTVSTGIFLALLGPLSLAIGVVTQKIIELRASLLAAGTSLTRLGLISILLAGFAALTAQTGSVRESFERMALGSIAAIGLLLEKVNELTESFAGFQLFNADAITNVLDDITGRFEELDEQAAQRSKEAFEKFEDSAKNAAQGALKVFDEVRGKIGEVNDELADLGAGARLGNVSDSIQRLRGDIESRPIDLFKLDRLQEEIRAASQALDKAFETGGPSAFGQEVEGLRALRQELRGLQGELDVRQVLVETAEAFKNITRETEVFGSSMSGALEQSQLASQAIQELIALGLDPASEAIQRLSEYVIDQNDAWEVWRATAIDTITEVKNIAFEGFQSLARGIGQALADFIVYQKDLGKAAIALIKSVVATIIAQLITLAIESLVHAIFQTKAASIEASAKIGSYAGVAAAAAAADAVEKLGIAGIAAAPALATAAAAAVTGSAAAAIGAGKGVGASVTAEHGLITKFNRPVTALIGEGREREVVSPLSDLQRLIGGVGGQLIHLLVELDGDILFEKMFRAAPDALERGGVRV